MSNHHRPIAQNSERWNIQRILQMPVKQGKPFLSKTLGAYLDIGDFVEVEHDVNITPLIRTRYGLIVGVKPSNDINNSWDPTSTDDTAKWVQINWWVSTTNNIFTPVPSFEHVALPTELIRTNYVQWVPEHMILDVCFIFHIEDILSGYYGHTHGMRNVFFCNSIWDCIQPLTTAYSHPYYSIFAQNNNTESHAERLWGIIEKVQVMFLKTMGRRGESQKLNYTESVTLTQREWKMVKSRFHRGSCCLFQHKGNSTIYRYGINLCKETIRKKNQEREVIVIENSNMLQQLILAFGTCVVSTVRSRFPSGAKVRQGATQTQVVNKLKTTEYVNSLLELSLEEKDNCDVTHSYRKATRGVDFCYNFGAKKFTLAVRYSMLDADDDLIKSFYTNMAYAPQEEAVNQGPSPLVDKEFEAFQCLFQVTRVQADNVDCLVTESENTQYILGSTYIFSKKFVSDKHREYLLL